MSLLGKYRKEEETREEEKKLEPSPTTARHTPTKKETRQSDSVPNKERKSPIVSFSIATDLRSCLQAVRNERMINLSMWVERKLREAITKEFPDLANQYLE